MVVECWPGLHEALQEGEARKFEGGQKTQGRKQRRGNAKRCSHKPMDARTVALEGSWVGEQEGAPQFLGLENG